MQINYSIEDVFEIIDGGSVEGSTRETIVGIASLGEAKRGDLSFLGNKKYRKEVSESQASLILLPEDYEGSPNADQVYIRVANPSFKLTLFCEEIERNLRPKPAPGIHSTAFIDSEAEIGENVSLGPFCVVESGAQIEAGCILEAHVFVGKEATVGANSHLRVGAFVGSFCALGKHVDLQPGAVVGSDGFGYETVEGAHRKIPQLGRVVLEDNVEIGANVTLDRARFSETVVGKGTKIDNLVQIAHNVTIGQHCIIAAQVGISGSTSFGDYVVVGGQAGFAGHLKIGKGVKVAGQAGIINDIDAGNFVRGNPANPIMLENKISILKKRLPELFKRVANLEEMWNSQKDRE